jgi:predicted anti-sigma-YlaC factor YlaD
MQVDRHESICHIIDKSLLGTASVQEEQSLRDHLPTCARCRDYLNACNRTIRSLEGFRFEIDPGLDRKVLASLALRARQLETTRINRKQLWWSCFIALMLTVVGSFVALQLGALVAAVFQVESAQVQFGLVALWIAPSLCFCALFLLLPVSLPRRINKKGLSL